MFRKLIGVMLLAGFGFLATASSAQDNGSNQAYVRLLQLANDGTSVSLSLADGSTVLTNLAPGSVSDYLGYEVNRSTFVTLTIRPARGQVFAREWALPPLAPGHHTLALVGGSADGTLELIPVDEDTLCAGKLASGSCVILVNNIKGSPSLSLIADNQTVVDNAAYRQVVVGSAAAASYRSLAAVDANNSQSVIFRLQRSFFEPNVITIFSLSGNYPASAAAGYSIGTIRRVPVDSMTFLRGLTANLQLTDGTTLFATENIVAILEATGFDQVLSNPKLPLTIFAPTDGAVLKVAGDLYQCATSNAAAMRALILNHVLAGSYSSGQLVSAARLPTMAGTTHTFQPTSGGFLIDNRVRVSDSLRYPTINGMVYLVDTVLVPPGFADQYCSQG